MGCLVVGIMVVGYLWSITDQLHRVFDKFDKED